MKNSVARSCGVVSVLMPQARMNSKVSVSGRRAPVALGGRRTFEETKGPAMDMAEIGITAHGEGAQ